jgi:hypothetical protein
MKKNCDVVLLILIIASIICIAVLNSNHRRVIQRGRGNNINKNRRLPIYWGNGIPLEYEMRYTSEVSPEEKIYTISGNGNMVGPQCCPSAYSTSSGCVCPLLARHS